jgi:hypothetical protein
MWGILGSGDVGLRPQSPANGWYPSGIILNSNSPVGKKHGVRLGKKHGVRFAILELNRYKIPITKGDTKLHQKLCFS